MPAPTTVDVSSRVSPRGHVAGRRKAAPTTSRAHCSASETHPEGALLQCGFDQRLEALPDAIRVGRAALGHQDGDEFFRGVDPEDRASSAVPAVFARKCGIRHSRGSSTTFTLASPQPITPPRSRVIASGSRLVTIICTVSAFSSRDHRACLC